MEIMHVEEGASTLLCNFVIGDDFPPTIIMYAHQKVVEKNKNNLPRKSKTSSQLQTN